MKNFDATAIVTVKSFGVDQAHHDFLGGRLACKSLIATEDKWRSFVHFLNLIFCPSSLYTIACFAHSVTVHSFQLVEQVLFLFYRKNISEQTA